MRPLLRLARAAAACIAAAASLSLGQSSIDPPMPAQAGSVAGRVIVLPGIRNTRFHLRGFERMLASQLPGFDIELRLWGTPLLGLSNLRAQARNRETAQRLAAEIAAWKQVHPEAPVYLVGYSGGGGIAGLTVSALPAGVQVERLVLVAPALSPAAAAEPALRAGVAEMIVNYASERDLQVGTGTRWFGNIDGVKVRAVGHSGFGFSDPLLVEWRWVAADRAIGHFGNHVAYLGSRWQLRDLLPALDPRLDAAALRALFAGRHAAVDL